MLLTEDEARTKWCPFARVMDGFAGNEAMPGYAAAINRWPAECQANCIASGCMAWRWGDDENGEPSYQTRNLGGGHSENLPRGHCGLATRSEGG